MLYHGSPLPSCNIYVITVPYDLEQPGAYIESYHPIIPFDICDGFVHLLHHANVYISPIQAWIEEACESSCRFGKQFDEVLYFYDLPSNPSILNIHGGLHFLINMSLLWLVTKDSKKINFL